MSELYNYCHIAELTDRGCKREANEDWMTHFESPNGLVAVVCDGMGGHVGGKIASHTAVDAIKQYMMEERTGSPTELIVESMNVASKAIISKANDQPDLTGMGATCVMLIVRNGKVYIGSVGDSRVYLVRNHRIRQLTKDQSYVQMLVDAGSITAEQARHHPRKNEITNALGLKIMQPATVLPEAISPEAGDCFLLCSDGLSGMVSDNDICKVVSRQSERTQQQRVEELVHRAKQNGGVDNITCQIVEFSVNPNGSPVPWWRKNLWALTGSLAAILIIIVGIFKLCGGEEFPPKEHGEEIAALIGDIPQSHCTYLDTMAFEKGMTFMELKENPLYKSVEITLHKRNGKDTLYIVNHPLLLNSMKVVPDSCAIIETTNCEGNLSWRLKFTENRKENVNEVAISINDSKDSVYVFLIPLEEIHQSKAASQKQKSTETKSDGFVSVLINKLFGNKGSENEEKEEEPVDSVGTIYIKSKEPNQMVTLHSVKGNTTNTDFYFPRYAFLEEQGRGLQPKGWYSIQNDGSKCIITIMNDDEHPIPPNAEICIKTRPDCNQGKGIIIRVIKNE